MDVGALPVEYGKQCGEGDALLGLRAKDALVARKVVRRLRANEVQGLVPRRDPANSLGWRGEHRVVGGSGPDVRLSLCLSGGLARGLTAGSLSQPQRQGKGGGEDGASRAPGKMHRGGHSGSLR